MKARRFQLVLDPVQPPQGLAGAVLAIGNFDGVHRGHRAVIAHAQAVAAARGAPCAAVTFEPHPNDYFRGPGTIFRLTSQAEKASLVDGIGLDGMIVLKFDRAMATMPAEVFVRDVLVGRLGASAVVAGYDFHFGKDRTGSPAYLVEAGLMHGFEVVIVPPVEAGIDRPGSFASSTAARAALERGDVAEAATILGHPYRISGSVKAGTGFTASLGYPTANLLVEPSCKLRHGVYAGRALIGGCVFDAVVGCGSISPRGATVIKAHLLDLNDYLYGHDLQIDLIAFIRDVKQLDTLEGMALQQTNDIASVRAMLPNIAAKPSAFSRMQTYGLSGLQNLIEDKE